MNRENIRVGAKTMRRSIIITDIAAILLGILMIVFPDQSAGVICRGIGILLCILGVIRVVTYFASDRAVVLGTFSLVSGAAMLGFGVLIAIYPERLQSLLMLALGVALIVSGVMKVQYAIDFARLRVRVWWVQLIVAAAMIALGVLALTDPFGAANTLMVYTGISLVAGSAWDLISILWLDSLVKDLRQLESDRTAQENAVDTEYETVD